MAIPAPSLPSHRPRLRLPDRVRVRVAVELRKWPAVTRRLAVRRDAIERAWGSAPRFLIGLAVCSALALLVTLVVMALAVGSSPFWVVLLIPCLLGWYGLVNEFFLRRPLPEPKPATRARTRKTAADGEAPARAPRQRKTATATAAIKTQSKPAET